VSQRPPRYVELQLQHPVSIAWTPQCIHHAARRGWPAFGAGFRAGVVSSASTLPCVLAAGFLLLLVVCSPCAVPACCCMLQTLANAQELLEQLRGSNSELAAALEQRLQEAMAAVSPTVYSKPGGEGGSSSTTGCRALAADAVAVRRLRHLLFQHILPVVTHAATPAVQQLHAALHLLTVPHLQHCW
jgi:hypothetical protein